VSIGALNNSQNAKVWVACMFTKQKREDVASHKLAGYKAKRKCERARASERGFKTWPHLSEKLKKWQDLS
jgi:hypothetical protein